MVADDTTDRIAELREEVDVEAQRFERARQRGGERAATDASGAVRLRTDATGWPPSCRPSRLTDRSEHSDGSHGPLHHPPVPRALLGWCALALAAVYAVAGGVLLANGPSYAGTVLPLVLVGTGNVLAANRSVRLRSGGRSW